MRHAARQLPSWLIFDVGQKMKINLQSKGAQVGLFVVATALLVWSVAGIVDLIQTQNTRQVFAAIARANEQREKKGPSIESYEEFVQQLRKVRFKYATKDLRLAYADYVEGLEEGLVLVKAGKSTVSADEKVKKAHGELVRIAERNN